MLNTLLKQFLASFSDNLKSAIQNRKWLGLSVIAYMLVMAGAVAQAQQPKKFPRIGYLSQLDRATESSRAETIRQALREHGYIEGQNLVIEYRRLRLSVKLWEVRAADDFERVFAALSKGRPDGLYLLGGTLMRANEKRILDFALKNRLPSMYFTREFVDAGGLMSYGAARADSDRRVAYYVDRILNGAKAADLPVERPTKFELVINLKTAKQIGLAIPQKLLSRADRVIH
jgi:ABC-type uncharacterized transport system substrate-binding protein